MTDKEKAPKSGQFSQADPTGAQGESAVIINHGDRSRTLATPEWIPDEWLDAIQRAELAEYTTSRVALDGSTVWPADEVWP